ncbi:NAD(P)/FAD-dependent oxidoreductase [Pseudaestuariivita atlantica]|uniref:Cyclopropane-fatty-acyl-phospholipid synthase n=1 Tax=Pseudaestuariivita atlantica TaxID=1317121 RepID=A0A0L1JSQ3_9RHOB|nr:FAD-dependent oxidoreductase [Pseudaestuariivita atlantica]KNG94732.1 cyclopropane-fatty-acyl-phospholipid synthase [Pseudaestuariivita atlantica]
MPFDPVTTPRRRIAIVGGGISGMGAAYFLSQQHEVVLYEAEPRLGGHARTIKVGGQPVDTGFIVFNYANYPHLARLFADLDVPVVKSNMSFGASLNGGRLEYGLRSLGALFAQPRNAANPRFLRMVRDILRFNRNAVASARNREQSLGDFLDAMKLGPWFRDKYLLPLSGAIWSTPTDKIMDFPAYALVQFFENHALLGVTGQHQWYTVQGGSVAYVSRLEAALQGFGAELRLGHPVEAIRRDAAGVAIRAEGQWDRFDDVILATHSDDSLRMLETPTGIERAALGAMKYQPNDVVLHSDASIMPKRRAVWSSWNYTEAADKSLDRIDLTYWMNSLQPIPEASPFFVTLNTTRPIREDLIHDQVTLRHPVYDLNALAAQDVMRATNGANNTWYCGAWMKNGFHEDGLSSAIDVVERIGIEAPLAVAAE